MGHVGIIEAADHVDNGVGGADVGEELIAQALPLGGPPHKACNVHKFNHRRGEFLRLVHIPEPFQPLIRDGNHAHIGVDGAEGVVICRNAGVGDGVKKGGLAHVGQTDNA